MPDMPSWMKPKLLTHEKMMVEIKRLDPGPMVGVRADPFTSVAKAQDRLSRATQLQELEKDIRLLHGEPVGEYVGDNPETAWRRLKEALAWAQDVEDRK